MMRRRALAFSLAAALASAFAGERARAADPAPGADALATAYRDLAVRVHASAELDAETRASLERRIAWATESLDATRLASQPDIAVEKQRQEALDEALVTASIAHATPPIDTTPGAHESILDGALAEPVASYVPMRPPRRELVLLPGARESETDLISRTLLRSLADATDTLLVVPGLDRAKTAADVSRGTIAAADAFAKPYGFDVPHTLLGGVSNGAFLAFGVPLATGRRFGAYLAIAGGLPHLDRRAFAATFGGTPAYFVGAGRDPDVPLEVTRRAVRVCRASGVFARYYERRDAVASIGALGPAIALAWNDMIRGVYTIPDDGLGTMPTESLPI